MSENNPDELERIRGDIHKKIIILKDNAESDEELEKLENFESYFSTKRF